MTTGPEQGSPENPASGGFSLIGRLKRRGVLRVAFGYAMISWLLLQIADVVFEPLGVPGSMMTVLILILAAGFPVALLLAWFFEFTPEGIERDHLPESAERPAVHGVRRYADVTIIGVLLVIVAVLLVRQEGWIEEESAGLPVIAILPFDNISSDPEYGYFGEGLADTMIQKLGRLSELVVLASSSSFAYKGKDLDSVEIGLKLGATAVMAGSVQRAGQVLRVNTRLLDVESGTQLWAASYDRRLTDIFAVQDEIARAVTESLHLVLTQTSEDQLDRVSTTSISAYDAYILGQARLASRKDKDLKAALEYFRLAIAEDPDYALAHAGLAEVLWIVSQKPHLQHSWADDRAEAILAADTAMLLDPALGEAYLAQALVTVSEQGNEAGVQELSEEVDAQFRRAIELSPNSAIAYKYYSHFAVDPERILELLKKASSLDPKSGIIKTNIAEQYVELGNYEEALQWLRSSAYSVEPYFSTAYSEIHHLYHWETGQLDEAARWCRAWVVAHPDDAYAYLNYLRTLLDLGAWDHARDVLADVGRQLEKEPENMPMRYVELLMRSQLARATGEPEQATELASEFSRIFLQGLPSWPVMSDFAPASIAVFSMAQGDIRAGQYEQALMLYTKAYPSINEVSLEAANADLFRPAVMIGILNKLLGDEALAQSLLNDVLAELQEINVMGLDGRCFADFTVYSFLGQPDEAFKALETAIDAGCMNKWWTLKDGAFTADYAVVIADPRFERLYGRLQEKAARLKTEYLDRPNLPEGWMR